MNVVFLSPNYPLEMHEYTRGLAEVGARVYGVGDTPAQGLAPIKEVPAVKRRAASREHSPGEARRGRGVLSGMEHP